MELKNHIPERTDISIPDRYVSMSNSVARAAQGLTLAEKRIVAIGLAKTDSVPFKDAAKYQNSGFSVKLSAMEYSEAFDVSLDTAYTQLKSGADMLMTRQGRMLEMSRKGLIETKINWVGGVKYHHGEGWIEIGFTPQVTPHLLGLRSKFTSYKLKQASAFRSIYAWRLFECLQSWMHKGIWTVSVDKFNHAMEAPESFKLNFGMVRRNILEPALKELREKENMLIEVELKKSGRKVTDLVFKFNKNPQEKLF